MAIADRIRDLAARLDQLAAAVDAEHGSLVFGYDEPGELEAFRAAGDDFDQALGDLRSARAALERAAGHAAVLEGEPA